MLLESEALQLTTNFWPMASLAAGLAVAEAIDEILADEVRVGVKWPNDVYARGAKVGGILVETVPRRGGALVVGIGINVNNSIGAAPAEIRQKAIAICDVSDRDVSRAAVLIGVLKHLWYRLSQIRTELGDLHSHWRSRCILTGRSVELDLGQRRISGGCEGIDDDGALLVRTDSGLERYFSGVVTRFG